MLTKVLLTFIATIVLYYSYKLLFGKSNRFNINRMLLLTMSVFAFVFPFITIEISRPMPEYFFMPENFEILNYDNANVVTEDVKNNSLSLLQIVSIIYIVGVVLSFVKMIFNIYKINKIKAGKEFVLIDNVKVFYTNENHIPFSFFNNIFIGTSTSSVTGSEVPEPVEGNANRLILKHEMSHVKNRHSLDIILMEIMISFQWFNPFIYKIKKELQSVHEYIADKEAVENETDKSNYMMLLLQQCTADDFNAIANNFSFLLTKKRIVMITQKQKTKRMVMRMLLILPVFAMLVLLNTQCDNAKPNDEKQQPAVTETWTILEQPVYDKEALNLQDSIYRVTEVMPQYPGGPNEMMKYIQENIKYPQSAIDNKIEGRVFVTFVVEKDGSISNAVVLRGIEEACDAEALRVISSMPKWNPGQHKGEVVRTQFTIPIIYKFNN